MFVPEYAYIANRMPFDKVKDNTFVHATGRIIVGKYTHINMGGEVVEYEGDEFDDVPTLFYEDEEGGLEYV